MQKNLFITSLTVLMIGGILSSFTPSDNSPMRKDGQATFQLSENVTADDYAPGVIILKIKPEYRQDFPASGVRSKNSMEAPARVLNSTVQSVFDQLQVSSFVNKYSDAEVPEAETNSWGGKLVDLTLIYEINYASADDIVTAINKLLATGVFQYVEPSYIFHTQIFTPNDPNFINSGQYFIKKVKCDSAWDPAFGNMQGDTNVVIGIVDSGTDPTHPDLKDNLKHNYSDPINGIDDDGDGFVDNFSGWDLSMNDNGTTVPNGNRHGAAVSGDAAASTNNGTGVASPGFKCKFLPVKCADDASTTQINKGYEGITYAANHGCQIINCSWGGTGAGQYGQDVVNYATINKNAVVVVAAGNNGSETKFYPAAYENVLSVAATTSTDTKASFSNYGTWVGISAPGVNIYSTEYSNTYGPSDGTSMASPITAGCAALVKSKFPAFTPIQVREQLRATADNIYSVSGNGAYAAQKKLGAGRVNVYKAVTTLNAKFIAFSITDSTDNNDNAFIAGDTVRLSGIVTNYMTPATNIQVVMSTSSSYVTIVSSTVNVGPLGMSGTFNTSATPFALKINPTAPANSYVNLTFTITDGTYSSIETYTVLVNVDYLNVNVNDIQTTVTSKSSIGWNDADLNTRLQGLGMMYNDSNLYFECGLMIGSSSSNVSDRVRIGGGSSAVSTDFTISQPIKRISPSLKSDWESYGEFVDNGAASGQKLRVKHHEYAWSVPGDRKFIIEEFTIFNTGTSPLNNLYAGLYADWDIGAGGANNKGDVDKTERFGYIYSTVTPMTHAGIKLLTNGPFLSFQMENDGSSAGFPWTGGVYASYTKAQKYITLSTNRDQAAVASPKDVSNVVSSGPFVLNAGDSIIVAFALMAGDNVPEMINTAKRAQIRYDGLPTTSIADIHANGHLFQMESVMPNPSNGVTTFLFNLTSAANTQLTIYNVMGEKVATLINENMQQGEYKVTSDLSKFAPGVYFYNLVSGENKATGKMTIAY